MRLLAGLAAVIATAGALAQDDRPYPQGKRFPLGVYSVHTPEEMADVRDHGYNLGHTYHFKTDYLDAIAEAGIYGLPHLTDAEEADAKATIEALAAQECVGWWDLPEEQRWWREDEWALLTNLSAWTRKYDPLQRPNFMYLPGHYGVQAIAKYVPHLDIIGAGAYTEYIHQPRSWVRWRIETQIEAIKTAGFAVGSDYLNGEKTPIGIPMLFADLETMDVITPVEAYHDFYSCIAAGARGIVIFSYWHKRDLPVLQKTWEAYAKAGSEINGEEGLGDVILWGEDLPKPTVAIAKGPQQTAPFAPYGHAYEVRYPSVNVLAKRYEEQTYLIAVNSSERAVTAEIAGLEGTEAAVLFEDRTVEIVDGKLVDEFGWLGVHVYRM